MSDDRPPIDCGSWSSTEIVGGDTKETFVWKIKGFKDHRETYNLNTLSSRDYVIKGLNGTSTTWMLEVEQDVRYGYVKIWAHNKVGKNLRVKIDVSVLNRQNLRNLTISKSHTFNNVSKIDVWNYSTSDIDRMLPNGDLTIICDITILGLVSTSSVETKEEWEKRSNSLETTRPTLNQSLEVLAEDFKKFFLTKEMSDVQIKCGDQTFDAHQSILSARSPVFSRMLQSEMKEKTSGRVILRDTSPDVVSELLSFIYTGSCSIYRNADPEMACELLEAADKYELEHLKEMCQYTLSSSLTTENSLQYLALGDMCGAQSLKKRALDMIVKNRKTIMETEEWKECAKRSSLLMVDIAEALANLYD